MYFLDLHSYRSTRCCASLVSIVRLSPIWRILCGVLLSVCTVILVQFQLV